MLALTIQSNKLKIKDRTYPNGNCNHKNALPVYKRLFSDYNIKYNTDYKTMFWAFSDLLTDDLDYAVNRASEMIGESITSDSTDKVYILDIPDEICLVTDFYNFSDEIFAYEFPNELESAWNSIYSDRKSEKQIIFPYIESDMILRTYDLSSFAKY